jgi:hypothetical protein
MNILLLINKMGNCLVFNKAPLPIKDYIEIRYPEIGGESITVWFPPELRRIVSQKELLAYFSVLINTNMNISVYSIKDKIHMSDFSAQEELVSMLLTLIVIALD